MDVQPMISPERQQRNRVQMDAGNSTPLSSGNASNEDVSASQSAGTLSIAALEYGRPLRSVHSEVCIDSRIQEMTSVHSSLSTINTSESLQSQSSAVAVDSSYISTTTIVSQTLVARPPATQGQPLQFKPSDPLCASVMPPENKSSPFARATRPIVAVKPQPQPSNLTQNVNPQSYKSKLSDDETIVKELVSSPDDDTDWKQVETFDVNQLRHFTTSGRGSSKHLRDPKKAGKDVAETLGVQDSITRRDFNRQDHLLPSSESSEETQRGNVISATTNSNSSTILDDESIRVSLRSISSSTSVDPSMNPSSTHMHSSRSASVVSSVPPNWPAPTHAASDSNLNKPPVIDNTNPKGNSKCILS